MFCCLALTISCACAVPDIPELSSSLAIADGSHRSSDGVVELNWSGSNGAGYQLEHQTGDGAFSLSYEGPDQASVRTGLPAGEHVFRVRAINDHGEKSEWSEIRVTVEYMEASRVRLLLLTGGVVVLATIIAIIHGHLTHRREESA